MRPSLWKMLAYGIVAAACAMSSTLSADNTADKFTLGYYENLGAMTFVLYTDAYRRTAPKDEKTKIAREYWFVAFTYWCEVRAGSIPESTKVMKAIWKVGMREFSPDDRALCSDPLLWIENDKPLMTPAGFKGFDKERYEAERTAFVAWLQKMMKDGEQQPAP